MPWKVCRLRTKRRGKGRRKSGREDGIGSGRGWLKGSKREDGEQGKRRKAKVQWVVCPTLFTFTHPSPINASIPRCVTRSSTPTAHNTETPEQARHIPATHATWRAKHGPHEWTRQRH